MANQLQLTPQDIIGILRRRWLLILPIFFLVASVSFVYATVIPPVYQSTGVILVESQQIPDELVRSTVTSFADERIDVIKQRVMTRENLLRVIDKYELFSTNRSKAPVSVLIGRMRRQIDVQIIDQIQRRKRTTITFRVSFSHGRPDMAHRVANELVTLFLEENVKTRTARASETTQFLAREARKLEKELERTESEIAAYKQEYSNALPEHLGLHTEMLQRAKSAYKETERDIKATKNERQFLELQLAAARSGNIARLRATADNVQVKSPARQLAQLQNELTALSVRYRAAHPDVRAVMNKIRALEEEIAGGPDKDRLQTQLLTAQAEYADVRRRYGPNHRDLRRLKQEIAGFQQQIDRLADQDSGGSSSSARPNPDAMDPADAAVRERISGADGRLESFEAERRELAQEIDELEQIIIRTPQVGVGLTSLSRDYVNALNKYEETRAKQMEAQLSENLEEEQKAERLSLLETPSLPERPISPNRLRILGAGLFVAAASGGGAALLTEMLNQSIRGARKLAELLKQPPIAVIPYVHTTQELRRRRWRRIILSLTSIAALVAIIVAIHVLYIPLDVLGAQVRSIWLG